MPGVSSWISALSPLVRLTRGSSLTVEFGIAAIAIASCLVIALCLWIFFKLARPHVSEWFSSIGLEQSGQCAALGGMDRKRRLRPVEISQSDKVVDLDVGKASSQ